MGEVYRARDTELGRTVAVKVLRDLGAARHDQRARFRREARSAAALNHPNIATIFDFGEEPGAPLETFAQSALPNWRRSRVYNLHCSDGAGRAARDIRSECSPRLAPQ